VKPTKAKPINEPNMNESVMAFLATL
ncbi:uncharacterized protein METZ01_LOCUS315131, partial [marine metagenome]